MNYDHIPDTELVLQLKNKLERESISKTLFSKMYNMNSGNFSQWMSGKKVSPTSRKAAIHFLFEIGNKEEVSHEKINAIPQLEISIPNDIERLIIIDGDQQTSFLATSHKQICDLNCDTKYTHTLFCYSHQVHSSIHMVKNSKAITMKRSQTNATQACDVTLVSETVLIDQKLNKAIPFIFVTKDRFVVELISRIKSQGRDVKWFETCDIHMFDPKTEFSLLNI